MWKGAGGVAQHCTDQGSHTCQQEASILEVLVMGNKECRHPAGVWPLQSPKFRPLPYL